jgi:membrane fusion protein, heavy metal efflux system
MKFSLLICILMLAASCHQKPQAVILSEPININDTIVLPAGSNILEKIATARVVNEKYRKKLITSAVVRAIPNNYAEIASPFSGRITKSFVSLGQEVNAGDPVFEIISPGFFEAGKYYYQSKQEMELAEKNLKRQQDLFNNGVGSQKDLEETELNYGLSKRDYENSIASLGVYHVKPEELVLGQALIVRSPIKGEIVENNIVIGQYLKEDAEPVAIVAELSNVWVIGQLKEKDILSVHNSDEAEIRLSGLPETTIKGRVFHIGEILDEETRSVRVFVACPNKKRIMKPGMFVTTEFSEDADNTILIPSEALYQTEGSVYVFTTAGKNRFVRRNIVVDGTDGDRVIVKSGLQQGDTIVTTGGFFLLNIG